MGLGSLEIFASVRLNLGSIELCYLYHTLELSIFVNSLLVCYN
jgi:hypothetical protein